MYIFVESLFCTSETKYNIVCQIYVNKKIKCKKEFFWGVEESGVDAVTSTK